MNFKIDLKSIDLKNISLDDIQAKELFPNGWNALKPYLRLVSDPSKQNNK